MDPNVRSLCDEILERIDRLRDDSGERWERWERRFEEVTTERQEHDEAVDRRIKSLEDFAAAQYTAAVVSDNWGAHFDERVSDLEQRMMDLELIRIHEINDERDDRVAAVEGAVGEINDWRPGVDGLIDALRWEVKKLRASGGGAVEALPTSGPLHQHGLVAARSPAGTTTDWPKGHGVESTTRAKSYGVVTTVAPTPANGMCRSSRPPLPPNPTFTVAECDPNFSPEPLPPDPPYPPFHSPHLGQLPKMHFPQFDGTTPQLWITHVESYFDMYSVDPSVWVRDASMQFIGPGKRWIQSIAHRLAQVSWTEFYILLHERFCRDQHELLLRQLFNIRQTASVQEYADQFVDLVEQLSAYSTHPDTLSYTTRFIDGLRDDIRSVVLIQRLSIWILLFPSRVCRKRWSSHRAVTNIAERMHRHNTSRRHLGHPCRWEPLLSAWRCLILQRHRNLGVHLMTAAKNIAVLQWMTSCSRSALTERRAVSVCAVVRNGTTVTNAPQPCSSMLFKKFGISVKTCSPKTVIQN